MLLLTSRAYRCIVQDHRGHGRSSRPWNGSDPDTYADDLAALVKALDLRDDVYIIHSTGRSRAIRHIGYHVPKLIFRGDQIVPMCASALLSSAIDLDSLALDPINFENKNNEAPSLEAKSL